MESVLEQVLQIMRRHHAIGVWRAEEGSAGRSEAAERSVLRVCVVGGVDMMAQAIALARKPHVVVGTPGRVVDHLSNTRGFSLGAVRFLVLDEADRMLSMDFETEIETILSVLPRPRPRDRGGKGGGEGDEGGEEGGDGLASASASAAAAAMSRRP